MVHLGLDAVLAGTPSNICKTKVVCTLGPKSRSVEVLEELLRAGMSVARFNFSHGTHEYHQETLDNLRKAMYNTKIMCATMLDTKGPEIRTGTLQDGKPIQLTTGQEVTVTTDYAQPGHDNSNGDALIALRALLVPLGAVASSALAAAAHQATDQIIDINLKRYKARMKGSLVGKMAKEVLSCNPSKGTVRARCLNTAVLGERKNVNLPGVVVDLPTLIEKDIDDITNWAVPNDVDFVAASFVRKGSDLDIIRNVLGEKGRYIKIISKVENQEGIQNFDDILAKTDSVMVARGDLGMEIPTEKIFLAQKMMIQKCNYSGKPVITATQMLESMIKNPRPTRAEATDVANAVLDGSDCVMLSGETAAGSFPVEAVKVMTKICREAEASLDYYAMFKQILKQAPLPMSPLESLASSAVRTAHKVHASLIVVLTRGGSTARLVAKYRPLVPVLTVAVPVLTTDSLTWTCSGESPARQCLVTRGLIPLLAEGSARATDTDTTDEILAAAIEHAKKHRYCTRGDSIVALHRIGNASVIKIVDIK